MKPIIFITTIFILLTIFSFMKQIIELRIIVGLGVKIGQLQSPAKLTVLCGF